MALRPYDWSPLGLDSDPVPGNPEAVSAESRRLGQTAQELRAQITMLQKIAGDSTLKGQYASTLRAHAQQLSQDLGKVAVRYENAADATGEWSADLAEAQGASLAALRAAETPYEQLRRLQAPQPPSASAAASATASGSATAAPADRQRQYAADLQRYQQAESSAQAAMTDAQTLLGRATNNRDAAGAKAARKISGASHDSLADSWWDQFKQMISGIADNLKTIATVIGYIATACALLAVILTGPLALVFLLVAGGLLFTELGLHTVLAATGNGSWVDVGLDTFALATLGYGGALDAGAEALEDTAKEAGAEAVQESQGFLGVAEQMSQRASELEEIAKEFGNEDVMKLAGDARGIADGLKGVATSLGKKDIEEFVEKIERNQEAFKTVKAVIEHGSSGTGNALDIVTGLAERFPNVGNITQSLKGVQQIGLKNAITFMSGTTVDATDKALSLASDSYSHLKDHATWALPADIGIPVVTAAELFGPTDFILHTTEFSEK